MRTTPDTRLIGVLAHPRGANLMFDMFSAAVELRGDDAAFHLFDTQPKEIATPTRALQTLGSVGLYLSGRLRSSALGLVDYLSDEAHGTSVLNVVTIDGDETTGHNTEAKAMIAALTPYRDIFATSGAVVLGAGAAARAAIYALVRHFRVSHLAIANRTLQSAQVLKQEFAGRKSDTVIEAHELFPPDIAQLLVESRLIINATSIGSFPGIDETPITIPDVFHSRQVVVDTCYSPAITRMLNDASSAGATTISGVELLLAQVGEAYELLAGAEFPIDEIRNLLVTNAAAE